MKYALDKIRNESIPDQVANCLHSCKLPLPMQLVQHKLKLYRYQKQKPAENNIPSK